MSRLFWIIAAIATILLATVRYFPLSWAASALPPEAGEFSGTIWKGQVRNVPLLGQASLRGSLSGVVIDSGPGDVTLRGTVSPSGAKDLILSMPIAKIPAADGRLQGLLGRLSLRLDEAVFDAQRCESARGTASTDVLSANRARFEWTGPDLSGPVDCVDGKLRVQLSGADAGQTVRVNLLSGFDGLYIADVDVTTNEPMAANVLALFGFSQVETNRFTLNEQGRWR